MLNYTFSFKHCFNSIQLIFTYIIVPNIQFEILYFPMILLWSMIYIEACCSVSNIWIFFIYIFEEGNGTPLQYSCLENSMDGGAW